MICTMGGPPDQAAARDQEIHDSYGMLVGWTHREFNDRLDLKLQTLPSDRIDDPGNPDSHHFILTRSQAAVLANYLFQVSGMAPPTRRRRGIFGRLFGS